MAAISTPTSLLNIPASPTAVATPTPARAPLPGEQVFDLSNNKVTPVPNTSNVPPAPKNPTAAPAITPSYSFLDGSKYDSSGKQISPPTVVTAKPATEDLANKQAALTQVQQAQSQQQQNISTQQQNTNNTPPAPAPAAPAATADDLNNIINGTAGQQGASQVNNSLQAVQDAADATFQSFQTQVAQLLNGTFPLTPAQQAQVNATQASFNQLKAAQDTANQNLLGQIRVQSAVSGINMTAPMVETGQISAAVNSGIQQIANIDTQASKAVADLQQGFMTSDYNMINSAYSQASKLFADKTTAIQDMNTNVRNATNDALTLHKQQVDEQQQQLQNQQAAIQFAQQNGITQPYYLVGNTAYDTKTGLPVSLSDYQKSTGQQVGLPPDQTDFSKIQHLADPSVAALIAKYPDAGISPIDSIATATAKLQKSAIYRKETYIAPVAGSGGSSAPYVPGADPTVDSWVANINSGKAKFSDVPALYKSQVSQGLAASGNDPTSDILNTTQTALNTLQDYVTQNHGFEAAVGAKNILTNPFQAVGIAKNPIAGTSAADFDAKLKQTVNDVVLPNLTLLHGLGRVTDREFQALQSAITDLSPNLSESEFKTELTNVIKTVNDKIAQTQTSSTSSVPKGTDGTAYGYPGYVSDGTQWVQQ